MIIVKTTLRKIPDSCTKCRYYQPEVHYVFNMWAPEPAYCILTDTLITKKYIPERRNHCIVKPDNCPLVEAKSVITSEK